jgi:hypothetical protein
MFQVRTQARARACTCLYVFLCRARPILCVFTRTCRLGIKSKAVLPEKSIGVKLRRESIAGKVGNAPPTAASNAVRGLLRLLQGDTAGLQDVIPLVCTGPSGAARAKSDLALCSFVLDVAVNGRNSEVTFHEDVHDDGAPARRTYDGLCEVLERAFGSEGAWVAVAKEVRGSVV